MSSFQTDRAASPSGRQAWAATYYHTRTHSIWAELPFVGDAVAALAQRAAGPVLEIPCGGGRNTGKLAAGLPFLLAADISREALAVAQNAIDREFVSNCGLVEADVFDLPFPDRSMHGAFCADLLGHLRRPDAALAELVRVTRPGGRIVANFFAPDDPTRRADGAIAVGPREYMYRGIYFRYDTIDDVTEIVDIAGTEIVAVERVEWEEGPHNGYRDYPHEHRSILVVLEVVR
jgi:SAM-dependent methyltransferase